MKINVRLLLITFSVIVIISLSSAFIYYSTTTSLLKNQHSKTLLNSKTDFNIALQKIISSIDNELYEITESKDFSANRLSELDFIFRINENKKILENGVAFSDKINKNLFGNSFDKFLEIYPNIILKYYQSNSKEAFYYGKIIDEELLDELSEKIRAELVLIIDNIPYVFSHQQENKKYLADFSEAANLKNFNKREKVFYKELENEDFFAGILTPEYLIFQNKPISFLLFNVPTDLAEFREKIKTITITIAFAGVLLALIFILLFTTKFRKQISLLSEGTKIISEGDLSYRVPVISNDELGNLGKIFNNMLDHIQANEKLERQYSELITIINETPLLKELTDTVLEKILQTTEISFGVFYLVDNNNAKVISSYGINQSVLKSDNTKNLYSDVIENKKIIELTLDESPSILKTGLTEIQIRYLLIMPIVFNKKVLGIIELACEHKPQNSPLVYLNRIKEQLAVGLNSAVSYEQLENLVNELRILNDEYQKQNLQISQQNSELIELHEELKRQTEELEKQRKKAVELSIVKSQFLANMSHELRTPLNSILGLTELIAEDSTTFPKTKDRLKIVLRNGKKLLAMINNILEFSKIEAGKFEITKSTFSLSEFLLDIFNAMEPLVTEKGLNFRVVIESEYDILINTDRHKLEQILLNLLSNAIKFTEVGEINIICKPMENLSLKIDVVDTGIGISDEDKIRIFNEFEQVDFTSSRKYQGAGLGLAICKKYTNLLGGKITVTNNYGQGSIFSLLLSNVILEKFLVNEKICYQNKIADNEHNRKKIILINRDESDNRNILNFFSKNNFDVVESKAESGVLNQLKNILIDGIILDMKISSPEEWMLIYNLKANKELKNIPFFFFIRWAENKNFMSDFTIDFVVDIYDKEYWKKTFSLARNYYKKEINSFKIISNKTEEIEKNIVEIDGKNLIPEQSDKISAVDLIIIDLSLFTGKISDEIINMKIPVIFVISEQMILNDFEIIKKTWMTLAEKYSVEEEIILKVLTEQIFLTKEIENKATLTSQIKSHQEFDDNIEADKSDFNVLVVDDDQDTQYTVGEILQNIGCKITYANNGAECLSILKEMKPDLILLDIMMPVMDGFETIKKIRISEETKNIKVYAVTAQAMLDDIDIIKNNGFDDLITKPVNASTLSFKIQKAIQLRRRMI